RTGRVGPIARRFSTKVHVSVSRSGLQVELRLRPGQSADATQAEPLLMGYSPAEEIADKEYDSDPWRGGSKSGITTSSYTKPATWWSDSSIGSNISVKSPCGPS